MTLRMLEKILLVKIMVLVIVILLLAVTCLAEIIRAQGPTGRCATCGYQGNGWDYRGSTYGNYGGAPPFDWYNCPSCHSTRVVTVPGMVPGGINPWTGRGAGAYRGFGGYNIRSFEERWAEWQR
jgi:hypothetical protein